MNTSGTSGGIETFLAAYPFLKECVLVFISVVLGGVCTVAINNGAMRKKCRFDMQHDILKAESKKITKLHKALEELEIGFSFINKETSEFKNKIEEIDLLLLKTNESLRTQRKFVRKYLSATLVEKSAQLISDYHRILFRFGAGGFMDMQIVDEINSESLNSLRMLVSDVQKLSDDMTESLEKLISPSIFARIKRKFRKPVMIIEELHAISSVHRVEKKKKK